MSPERSVKEGSERTAVKEGSERTAPTTFFHINMLSARKRARVPGTQLGQAQLDGMHQGASLIFLAGSARFCVRRSRLHRARQKSQ
jgi:hypothetical protein